MRKSLSLLDSVGEVASLTGSSMRGAGWFGPTSGLHSVSIRVLNFVGRISIQGSLAATPGDDDWFSVLPAGKAYLEYPQAGYTIAQPASGETSTTGFNFICNVVWVRAVVDRSYLMAGNEQPMNIGLLGTVDSILLNY